MNTSVLKKKAQEIEQTQVRGPYYFITSALTVDVSDWKGTRLDQRRENVGNLFKSREAAQKAAEVIFKALQK